MKNIACLICSPCLLFFVLSCGSEGDMVSDEEAIKAVINGETQAWIDKNPAKQKEYYVHDAYQTRVNIQDSVYYITTGWEKRSTEIDTVTKYTDWLGVDEFRVEKDFLNMKIMGNTAWVILRETQQMTYNGSPATSIGLIYVVLEKVEKDWKISCFVKSYI